MLDYYATPHVRTLCHQAKNNDPAALLRIAEMLSVGIRAKDTITPIPNRHGEGGAMRVVCDHIAKITGCTVWDGLQGVDMQSQYAAKKNGAPLSSSDFGLSLKGRSPFAEDRHLLIDAILDTGATMNAALSLLPGAKPMPFATVDKLAESRAISRINAVAELDVDAVITLFDAALSAQDAFALGYQAVSRLPQSDKVVSDTLKRLFPKTPHAGLQSVFDQGFIAAFNLDRPIPVEPPGALSSWLRMAETLSVTLELHEAGFHFEEGGCWGFAAALYDRAHQHKLSADIVLMDDTVHCYVKIGDLLFDHQGLSVSKDSAYSVVDRNGIVNLAMQYGVEAHDVVSDIEWANSVLDDAFETFSPSCKSPQSSLMLRR